ncbi:hypothetical protein QWJ07_10585 [Frankia sp. RB7]|nr:hypothetical protein [Frankia sp. RB7]
MDEQQNRVIPILAADLNPLLDAADIDKRALLHAVGGADRESFGGKMLAIGAKAQTGSRHNNEDAGQSQQRDPNQSCGLARHLVLCVDWEQAT